MRKSIRLVAFFVYAAVMMIALWQPASAQADAAASETAGDYQLGIQDELRVTVFNEPNLSGQFVVNSNGMLSLPLIALGLFLLWRSRSAPTLQPVPPAATVDTK